MAKLTGKLGAWELDHVHMWKDRGSAMRAESQPIVGPQTRIATIGSCFAEELAAALSRFDLEGGMHPGGLFYNSRSIRQELERLSGSPTEVEPWRTQAGLIDPLRSYFRSYPDIEGLRTAARELDIAADRLFQSADIVVVTLGLVETWVDPESGLTYRQIPHPEVFNEVGARLHRQSVGEIERDLERILEIVTAWRARLVVTVSPVPLHATMTPLDVRIANTESKSRIRAAVSQFVERHLEVSYFHSYEMIATAERAADFLLPDGRHVRRRAVDLIVRDFLRQFGTPELAVSEVDASWVTAPRQTAARPRAATLRLLRRRLVRFLGGRQ